MFKDMWATVKFNKEKYLWEGPSGTQSTPFAALSAANQRRSRRWWDKWGDRPEGGKEKVRSWNAVREDAPPHP